MDEIIMAYPIQVVARKTGLTQETLRAWERRYDGIQPRRDDAGRRLYSEALLEKLTLLAELTAAGYRIGQVADRGIEELRELAGDMKMTVDEPARPTSAPGASPYAEGLIGDASVAAATAAVAALDDIRLYRVLENAIVDHGRLDLIDHFVFPLVRGIEERVDAGELRSMHLAFITTTLRTVLSSLLVTTSDEGERPVALLCTPYARTRDLAVVASAIHAHAAGWRPVVLGTGIAAEDLMEAVRRTEAKAVILGVGHGRYDFTVVNELTRVRKSVPGDVPVYFGGRLSARLIEDLTGAGLRYLHDMDDLRRALEAFAEGA